MVRTRVQLPPHLAKYQKKAERDPPNKFEEDWERNLPRKRRSKRSIRTLAAKARDTTAEDENSESESESGKFLAFFPYFQNTYYGLKCLLRGD